MGLYSVFMKEQWTIVEYARGSKSRTEIYSWFCQEAIVCSWAKLMQLVIKKQLLLSGGAKRPWKPLKNLKIGSAGDAKLESLRKHNTTPLQLQGL